MSLLDIFALSLSVYFLSYLPTVHTFGVFEVDVYKFQIDQTNCSVPCQSLFKVCVKYCNEDIRCKFSATVLDYHQKLATFYFPVDIGRPCSISYIIEAWPDASLDILNKSYRVSGGMPAGFLTIDYFRERWFSQSLPKMDFAYRFTCDVYNVHCTESCLPRSDRLGHYTCSQNGSRVCKDGWEGEFCDSALCLPGCHPNNGYCDSPNTCKCLFGWEGPFCNIVTSQRRRVWETRDAIVSTPNTWPLPESTDSGHGEEITKEVAALRNAGLPLGYGILIIYVLCIFCFMMLILAALSSRFAAKVQQKDLETGFMYEDGYSYVSLFGLSDRQTIDSVSQSVLEDKQTNGNICQSDLKEDKQAKVSKSGLRENETFL